MDGALIKHLRRRLGMTQRQLAEKLNVDQGTVSRWERSAEAPRPRRLAALQKLLLDDQSRRAMLRSTAFVRQDYLPSTLLDGNLRMIEMSFSAQKHISDRGMNPDAMLGKSFERIADRFGAPGFSEYVHASGLLKGDCLLFRFVRNHNGRGHATVYEPIFEDENLVGVLNFVTDYFPLPPSAAPLTELIEVVRADDLNGAVFLHRGPNADVAMRALQRRQH